MHVKIWTHVATVIQPTCQILFQSGSSTMSRGFGFS